MNQFGNFLNIALSKLGFLNDDAKVSLTNISVIVFISIIGFRSLFAGMALHFGSITWTIAPIDLTSTLPMAYSLLNYGHKRLVASQTQGNNQ